MKNDLLGLFGEIKACDTLVASVAKFTPETTVTENAMKSVSISGTIYEQVLKPEQRATVTTVAHVSNLFGVPVTVVLEVLQANDCDRVPMRQAISHAKAVLSAHYSEVEEIAA